jgi:hypothetical protein
MLKGEKSNLWLVAEGMLLPVCMCVLGTAHSIGVANVLVYHTLPFFCSLFTLILCTWASVKT